MTNLLRKLRQILRLCEHKWRLKHGGHFLVMGRVSFVPEVFYQECDLCFKQRPHNVKTRDALFTVDRYEDQRLLYTKVSND